MTILDTIVEQKRREVARLPQRDVSLATLRAALLARGAPRDFLHALWSGADNRPVRMRASPASGSGLSPAAAQPKGCPPVALIAEVKKASPSAGLIRPDFAPVRIAREYEAAGATCLSVLTDEKFFQGSLEYLRDIRLAVELPLLRKDFIIDPRQVLQAIEWGADAILLIAAILTDAQLSFLLALATGAGLSALVEVHDESELARALGVGAELIGVNNRNLKTFDVDLGTTERLAACLFSSPAVAPPSPRVQAHGNRPLLVAESGIHTRADVERLARCGARAILVGESLLRHADPGAQIRELLG